MRNITNKVAIRRRPSHRRMYTDMGCPPQRPGIRSRCAPCTCGRGISARCLLRGPLICSPSVVSGPPVKGGICWIGLFWVVPGVVPPKHVRLVRADKSMPPRTGPAPIRGCPQAASFAKYCAPGDTSVIRETRCRPVEIAAKSKRRGETACHTTPKSQTTHRLS